MHGVPAHGKSEQSLMEAACSWPSDSLCDAIITVSISFALYSAKNDFGRSNKVC